MVRVDSDRKYRPGWKVAGLALTLSSAALAQERPNAFGVEQTFTHDSNLFRTPAGQPATRDVSSSTGLLGEVGVALGRQRLYASGNIRENRFRETSSLDNRSYALDAGWNWATAERLSGTVSYAIAESLAPYGVDSGARTTRKNVLQTRQLDAIARMGLVTQWSAEVSAQHRSAEYSAAEYAALNYKQDQGAVGLRYSPNPSLTLGTGLRYARGSYPQFQLIAPGSFASDRYTRSDVDLLATWKPTGPSTFVGRLSIGRQSHNAATQRDFKAATGSLSWAYQPTGKLQLTTTLVRDTGAETRFADSRNATSVFSGNDQSRLSTSVQLAMKYDMTAKWQLNGAAHHTQRSLVNSATSPTGAPVAAAAGNDRTRRLTLGARYALNRNWLLECAVARESRGTDTALSYAYSANTASCSAQFLVF